MGRFVLASEGTPWELRGIGAQTPLLVWRSRFVCKSLHVKKAKPIPPAIAVKVPGILGNVKKAKAKQPPVANPIRLTSELTFFRVVGGLSPVLSETVWLNRSAAVSFSRPLVLEIRGVRDRASKIY